MNNKSKYVTVALCILLIMQIARVITGDTDSLSNQILTKEVFTPNTQAIERDIPTTSRKSQLRPEIIARNFQTAYRSTEQLSDKPAEPVSIERAYNPYKFIGKVMDTDGISRLYIKNVDNNRIIRARLDGISEDGIRHHRNDAGESCITIDGNTYIIREDQQ